MSSNERWKIVFIVLVFLVVIAVNVARAILSTPESKKPVDNTVVEAECTVEGQGGFLRGDGDFVAVYVGNPDGCYTLSEVTDIRLDELPDPVQDALDFGIPFQDTKDLPQLIDGLLSDTG